MTTPTHCAFPVPENGETLGLTKREYFAAVALQGLVATLNRASNPEETSAEAVVFADALIGALNKTQ